MLFFVCVLLAPTGGLVAAVQAAHDAGLNRGFLAREHQVPQLGVTGRRLGPEYDFKIGPKTHRNNQGKWVHGKGQFLGSVGSPPKFTFSTREDAKWSVEVTQDGRSVFLSTLEGWQASPPWILDVDGSGEPFFTQLRGGRPQEWTMREDSEGTVFVEHVGTGRYLAVADNEEGGPMPRFTTSAGEPDHSAMFDIFPAAVKAALRQLGVLSGNAGFIPTPTAKAMPWWPWILLILLILLCCCGCWGGGMLLFESSSESPTEKKLRGGIDGRDLKLLQQIIPTARKEREEYDKKLSQWQATQPGAGAPAGGRVLVEFKLENIDHALVTEEQQEMIKMNLRKALSDFANVPFDAVGELELSSGSLKVSAMIHLPANRSETKDVQAPQALLQALTDGSSRALKGSDALAGKVSCTSFKGPFQVEQEESKPRDPVPSLEEAEEMARILEEELAARAKTNDEAKEIMDAIRKAMADRDLGALRVALGRARGKPGMDRGLLSAAYAMVHELEKERRREEAREALRAAVASRSDVKLRAAIGLAAPSVGDPEELREARELLSELERRTNSQAMPLLYTAMKQQDLPLAEKALEHSGSMPPTEVRMLEEHVKHMKIRVTKQGVVRQKLKKTLAGYESDLTHAVDVAEAIDGWRESGLSMAELHPLLQQWDEKGKYHEVRHNMDHKVIFINIKRQERLRTLEKTGNHPDPPTSVRALMPSIRVIQKRPEAKVWKEECIGKWYAHVPLEHELYFGPEHDDNTAAEADLTFMKNAIDNAEPGREVDAIRAAQLQLHLPQKESEGGPARRGPGRRTLADAGSPPRHSSSSSRVERAFNPPS